MLRNAERGLNEIFLSCIVKSKTEIRGNIEIGTGFFVAPSLLLTCKYVVQNKNGDYAQQVQIRWQKQEYKARIYQFPKGDLALSKHHDLALLELVGDNFNHPCVYLGTQINPGNSLFSYGYGKKLFSDQSDGTSLLATCKGPEGEDENLFTFSAEGNRSGFSGAPLLNQETGMVCGLIKSERSNLVEEERGKRKLRIVEGGVAIPTQVIFKEFPELIELQKQFHQTDNSWTSLLSELKLKKIPQNIPYSGVKEFVGRDQELNNLHQQFEQYDTVAITAIEGMGGVGKTELAIQYALSHHHIYNGGICWVLARSKDIGTQIVDFAKWFHLQPPEDTSLQNQVRYCWQNWIAGEVLLVIDDITDFSKVKPYLPPDESRFKVLMTTRLQLGSPIKNLFLDVLKPEAALDLLESLVGTERVKKEFSYAEELCEWLGYLPLGLELVGRYLKQSPGISLKKMLERLKKKKLQHTSMKVKEDDGTMTAVRGVNAAFNLSWECLEKDAQKLGYLLSLFALAPIPRIMVEKVVVVYGWDIEPDDLEEEVIADLLRLHLIKCTDPDEEIYQVHQLIREFFQQKLEDLAEAQINKMKLAFAVAMSEEAKQISDTLNLKTFKALTFAIRHIEKAAKATNQLLNDEKFYWLFIGLARFYNGQGLYTLVKHWCKQGLLLGKTLFGDTETSEMQEAIAILEIFHAKVLRTQQEYQLAIEKYQQNLTILQNSSEQQILVRGLRGLGHTYRLLGNQNKSIQNYEESRRLAKDIKYDKGLARADYGVARIYRLQGDLEKAENRYEEAKNAFKNLELPVEEAWAFFGLAEVKRMRWDLEQSNDLYNESLQKFKELGHKEGEAYAAWGSGDASRLLADYEVKRNNIDIAQKHFDDSTKDYQLSLQLCQELGDRRSEAWALLGLAEVFRMEGKQLTNSQEEAIAKYNDALSRYNQALSLVNNNECVEEAHAMLGIVATKRMLKVIEINNNNDLDFDMEEFYKKALEIYKSESRNLSYCIVDVLIERALYCISIDKSEDGKNDLNEAERICIEKNYDCEKKLIEKIRNEQDSSELHTLNFP